MKTFNLCHCRLIRLAGRRELHRGLPIQSVIKQWHLLYLCYTLNKYRNQLDSNALIRKSTSSYHMDTHADIPYFTMSLCISISFPLIVEPPFKPSYHPGRCLTKLNIFQVRFARPLEHPAHFFGNPTEPGNFSGRQREDMGNVVSTWDLIKLRWSGREAC